MIEDDPGSPGKRELQGGAEEEPEATRPRVTIHEGTGEAEERPDKMQKGEPSGTVRRIMATRSVQEVEAFLRKDLPRYTITKKLNWKSSKDSRQSSKSQKRSEGQNSEKMKSLRRVCRNGQTSSKLDEDELAKVDIVSREHEISRLTDMKVLKELPEGTSREKYKFLSTKVVYDWRHRDKDWQRRGQLVAREFKWLGSTDIANLFSPTRSCEHSEATVSNVCIFRRPHTGKH